MSPGIGARRHAPLRALCRLALVLLLLSGGAETVLAQREAYEAEAIKAAFLYHFATFVLWPEEDRSDGPFTIAVLGAGDIAAELEAYLPGRSIQGRPMRVQRLESLDELEDAAVLFIGASENERLRRLLQRVAGRHMLVVTDARDALELGSIINFRLVERRVRFEISLPAAERAGLELSSRLLSAAMFVDTTSAIPPPLSRALASWTAAQVPRTPRVFEPQHRIHFKG
jgi:hypothetical protein